MIQFLKNLFKKKDVDFSIKKIISVEDEKIKFNTHKVFSDEEKLIIELSFFEIEWIEIDSYLLDYSTLESCLYIKAEKNSILIDFVIEGHNQKEFVKELFKTFRINEKHLAFLKKQQKRKVIYTRDKSIKCHKIDSSETGIFRKK